MNRRMRVGELVFSLDVQAEGGGITRFVTALSQALDAEQFEPVVCGLWRRGSAVENEQMRGLLERGIQTFTCAEWDEKHPYAAFIQAYRSLRTFLKHQPVDILHSHSEFSDVAAMLLKLEGIAPIIVRTLHNGLPTEWRRKPLRRWLLSYLLFPLLYDREIGVSPHITQYLDQRWLARVLGRAGQTINNAVDLSRFRPQPENRWQVRQELGLPQDAYLVGSVGRLGIEKGYDLLIQAAAQVSQQAEKIYVLIVGDGKQAASLRQQAVEAGISQWVIFTGPRPDIERLLSSLDLFVCASRWEGLSTAILEAMASGVPVVATDIPGNREILIDGENAWLVAAENSSAIAAAIVTAMNKPERAKALAQRALADVLKYKIDRVAAQHGQLYQDLLSVSNL